MITGGEIVINAIQRKLRNAEKAVKSELSAFGESIVSDAKSNASGRYFVEGPDGQPEPLDAAVRGNLEGDSKYKVEVDAGNMGAYIEFGTGEFAANTVAVYPNDWKELAMSYYINGKGTMPASPYLLPAFYKNKAEAKERFLKVIREAIK